MTHSTLWLAEVQFFLSLSFMAVFFAIELGLSWVLFVFRLRSLRKNQSMWLTAYRTWVRVFALALVISLGASIPVIISLGSLWPYFLSKTAVLSSPFLAAVIVATLILKSCFAGLMLYAQRRLPPWVHALVVGAVALVNTLIVVLLLAWISWLHYPVGGEWSEGALQQVAWSAVFSNSLFSWYGILFLGASFLLATAMIQAMLSWQSLRRPATDHDRRVFRFSSLLSAFAWGALVVGVLGHGQWLAQHHPQKAAAMAGYWQSGSAPEWLLAAWSNESEQRNVFSFGLPHTETAWLGQDQQKQCIGLDKNVGMLPPVNTVFWAFRFAVGLGLFAFLMQARTFWLVCRRYFDPNMLSERWRRATLALPVLTASMLLCGLTYQLLGVLPYAVFERLTTSELYAHLPTSWLLAGILGAGMVYLLGTLGFVSLVRYAARYGVIPVARHRGRA